MTVIPGLHLVWGNDFPNHPPPVDLQITGGLSFSNTFFGSVLVNQHLNTKTRVFFSDSFCWPVGSIEPMTS